MSPIDVEALWEDRSHWTWGVIYHCAEDPRAIVPRRYRWGGWTLNFGNPRAGWVGLFATVLAVGPTMLALRFTENQGALFTVMGLSAAAVIAYAHREASRKS